MAVSTTGQHQEAAPGDGVVWVEAAPFRAHVSHLMAVGNLSVDVVAAMAGVPLRAARHLVVGRAGRPVRRLSAETGRRLLRITSSDARTVRRRLVSAHGAARQLEQILGAGLTLREIADRSGADHDLLADISRGARRDCSPLIAAQICALHTKLDIADDVEPTLG